MAPYMTMINSTYNCLVASHGVFSWQFPLHYLLLGFLTFCVSYKILRVKRVRLTPLVMWSFLTYGDLHFCLSCESFSRSTWQEKITIGYPCDMGNFNYICNFWHFHVPLDVRNSLSNCHPFSSIYNLPLLSKKWSCRTLQVLINVWVCLTWLFLCLFNHIYVVLYCSHLQFIIMNIFSLINIMLKAKHLLFPYSSARMKQVRLTRVPMASLFWKYFFSA